MRTVAEYLERAAEFEALTVATSGNNGRVVGAGDGEANSAVQALNAGDTLTDTFTVTTIDGKLSIRRSG